MNKRIEFAIFDLDGCTSKGPKFSSDLREVDRELSETEEFVYLMDRLSIRRSAATGRSLAITRPIIDREMTDISVAEHGLTLYDPATQREVDFIEMVSRDGLCAAKGDLERFMAASGEFEQSMRTYCAMFGIEVRQLRDKSHMYTVEFSPQTDHSSVAVAQYIEINMPQQLRSHLASGRLKKHSLSGSHDYMPPIGKEDGVDFVIKQLGVDPASVLAVGDSYASDGPMMARIAERNGYVLCPANSDKELKAYVAAQAKRGYVATQPYLDGVMEGLKHFFA